jgi:Topoisomerase IA
MKLILTEKPSVAEDFAKALGASKAQGYWKNDEFIITWAYGHLYEIDDSEFSQGKWDINALPIFPEKFKLRVISKAENYVKNQASVISTLVKNASEVIIAGDAGREGELIAREILQMSGWKGWKDKTFRFWSSESLTPDVIKRELKRLKPSFEFNPLYFSAIARQQGDWICGINLTRYTTCKVSSGNLWTAGRVQSPTLNLIVERDILIKCFQSVEYWTVKADFRKDDVTFQGYYITIQTNNENGNDINDLRLTKDKALEIELMVKSNGSAIVDLVEKTIIKQPPPLLFSLTELQKEANRLFGYSLDETLKYAQSLYETYKVLSYPRSDSTHLGNDARGLVHTILKKLSPDLLPNIEKVGKRVFDSTKLTDHHALIPLDSYNGMDINELNIYNLVVYRFCAAFMDDYIYETTSVLLKVSGHYFKVNGKVDISLGWKNRYKDEEEVLTEKLPKLSETEKVNIIKICSEQKFTKPPLHYNDRTLVADMKKFGLGTVATRPEILKRLINSGYLIRDNNKIIASDKGFEFIRLYEGSKIISVEYIASLEKKLDDIYEQKMTYEHAMLYVEKLKAFVAQQIEDLKLKNISEGKTFKTATTKQIEFAKALSKQHGDKKFDKKTNDYDYVKNYIETKKQEIIPSGCKCNGSLTISNKAFNCSCGRLVWAEYMGKKITQKQAVDLLSGRTPLIKGMKSKQSKLFDAKLRLVDDKGKVEFIFT